MNINATDLDNSHCDSDDWVPSSFAARKSTGHGAGHTLNSVLNRGKGILNSFQRQIGKEAGSASMIMHKHPYLAVLAGIGWGLAIGYLVAGKHNMPNG